VITEDVAPDALALGRGRQVQKPHRAAAFRAAKAHAAQLRAATDTAGQAAIKPAG
jgi:bifunctional UDP-N-acetylglucosamine pyrophosphorylase/glucosamine-1-phosphate N-acetyltransferase